MPNSPGTVSQNHSFSTVNSQMTGYAFNAGNSLGDSLSVEGPMYSSQNLDSAMYQSQSQSINRPCDFEEAQAAIAVASKDFDLENQTQSTLLDEVQARKIQQKLRRRTQQICFLGGIVAAGLVLVLVWLFALQ